MKKQLLNLYKKNINKITGFFIILLVILGFLYFWTDQIKLICYLDESVGKKVSSKNSSYEKKINFYKYQKKVIVFDVRGISKFNNSEEFSPTNKSQIIKEKYVSYDDNALKWGVTRYIKDINNINFYKEDNEVNRTTGYLTQTINTNHTAEFVWSCSEKKKLF
jgi:hypothetical protein